MRAAWLLLLAACGRLGFDGERPIDATARAADAADAADAGGDAGRDPSLVAWWQMEAFVPEGQAMGIADSSGVTNSYATCDVTCPTIVPGKIGNAVEFDGNDDILQAASMPSLADPEFTVGAWINIAHSTTGGTVQCPYNKVLGSGIYDSWGVCIFSNDAGYFYSAQTAMSNELDSTTPISLNTWHYVAIRFDGATKSLFEDGQLIATNTAAGIDFDDNPVVIGADIDNGSPVGFFAGIVDEVRIYNRALSDAEILALSH